MRVPLLRASAAVLAAAAPVACSLPQDPAPPPGGAAPALASRPVPGEGRPFPRLADMPEPPPVPGSAERQRLLEELLADPSGVRAAPDLRTDPPEIGRPPAAVAAAARGAGAVTAHALHLPAPRRPLTAPDGAPGRRYAVLRFAAGSARPPAAGLARLDRMAAEVRRRGGDVHITAHGAARLAGLAVARANAVAARFRRVGVPAARIFAAAVAAPPIPAPAAETGRVEVYWPE